MALLALGRRSCNRVCVNIPREGLIGEICSVSGTLSPRSGHRLVERPV